MENPNGFFERFERAPKFQRVVPMMKVNGKDRPEVLILSNAIRWKTVHWTGSRSIPCTNDPETCEGHKSEHPARLYGYLSVINGSKGHAILQLTHACGNDLEKLLTEHGRIRGMRIRLVRKGDKLRGEMRVEFMQMLEPDRGIPKDVDPEPTLRRLWGLVEPT